MKLEPCARALQTELLAKDAVLFALRRELRSLRASVAEFKREAAVREAQDENENSDLEQLRNDGILLKKAKQQLRAKQKELDMLKAQKEEAEEALRAEESVKDAALTRVRDAFKLIEEVAKENREVTGKLSELEAKQQPRSQVEEETNSNALQTELDVVKEVLEKLKAENDETVSALRSELESKCGELKRLQYENATLRQGSQGDAEKALQTKLDSSRDALTIQQKEIHAKDAVIVALKAQMESLNEEVTALAKDKETAVRTLEAGLGEKYGVIDQLKNERDIALHALKAKAEELKRITNTPANNSRSGGEHADSELISLQKYLDTARATIDKLQREVETSDQEDNDKDWTLNRLKSRKEALKESAVEAAATIELLRAELEEEKELRKSEKSKPRSVNTLQAMLRDKDAAIDVLGKEKEALQASLTKVRAELSDYKELGVQYKVRIDQRAMESRLGEALAVMDRKDETIEALRKDKKALQRELVRKKTEFAKLKKNKKPTASELREDSTPQDGVPDTVWVGGTLVVTALQEKLNQKEAELHAHENSINALQAELRDKDTELQTLQMDKEAAVNALRVLHDVFEINTEHNAEVPKEDTNLVPRQVLVESNDQDEELDSERTEEDASEDSSDEAVSPRVTRSQTRSQTRVSRRGKKRAHYFI